jgi:MFS family permease
MATSGTLIGPFIGAILFKSVSNPKIFWTWVPVGVTFLAFGILFLVAFRNFDDSVLIDESTYSKLDDSVDY